MDIRCERCGTEYEIDDARVTDAGVSVKCSTCELVFTVRAGMPASQSSGFQIRRDGQLLAACPDLATAQRWVSERRLLRSDELDRDGARTRLGEVPELLPFFALVDAAQRTPSPPTSAPRFTAPLFATNPSIPMPPREQPAASFRSTMQFHAPSHEDRAETSQLAPPDRMAPAATTRQFMVSKPTDAPSEAATELALPALTLPTSSKPPAVTMQFRVPVADVPPDMAKTESMTLPTDPVQPQGALPDGVDALETLQFKVPTGPLPAETLTGAPLLSAPAGARSRIESAPRTDETPALRTDDTSEIFVAAPEPSPVAPPAAETFAPTQRLPAVEPAWATGSASAEDDDPEILAFKQRGRGGRFALVLVLVVVVLAAVGWFVVKPMLDPQAPPPESEPAAQAPASPPEEVVAAAPVQPPEPAPERKPSPVTKAEPKKTAAKAAPKPAPKPAAKTVSAPAPVVEAGLFDDLPPPPAPAPVDVDGLIAQGNQWLKRGQPAKALEFFDQAVAERPGNAEAVYLRGVARFDLGRTDESIVDLKRALQISPRFADAMIVLADAWKTKGNVAEARNWYQKYLDVAPNGSDAAAARANLARLK